MEKKASKKKKTKRNRGNFRHSRKSQLEDKKKVRLGRRNSRFVENWGGKDRGQHRLVSNPFGGYATWDCHRGKNEKVSIKMETREGKKTKLAKKEEETAAFLREPVEEGRGESKEWENVGRRTDSRGR